MIMLNLSNEKIIIQRRLREAGFDKSSYNLAKKAWSVKCSCCKALIINGIPCHELKCFNLKKVQ